ncbi:MAG TPA: sugar phosphate isomerase/epimerase [Bryobacteraceae bacterium]|nr:sugar phosphate isomerase/epimerase [Bryobacteraceae bacterium]
MARSRRDFIRNVASGAIGVRLLRGYPLNLPPGLQLWSVREDLAKDEQGTLRKVAAIGYRDLEHYEMPASPAQFRRNCEAAGLKLVGSHFDMPLPEFGRDKTIEGAKAMGLRYMIVVFPTLRSLSGPNPRRMSFAEQTKLYEKISLDDYKWNADQLNRLGERVRGAGLQLGYHNHAIDLKPLAGGNRGLDTLIQGTDPNLVIFEIDCGHVIHAGADPVAYLRKYPDRIQLLHLKDLKPGYSISTTLDTEDKDTNAEIGAGVIDWSRLFAAARQGNVKHWFVEHEGRMDHPPLESIAISCRRLSSM